LDWGWMIGGAVAMVLAYATAVWCKKSQQQQAAPAAPAVPQAT
jgi:hypothetical protein